MPSVDELLEHEFLGEQMKRGELIILWVGGILSSLLLIVAAIGLPGMHFVALARGAMTP